MQRDRKSSLNPIAPYHHLLSPLPSSPVAVLLGKLAYEEATYVWSHQWFCHTPHFDPSQIISLAAHKLLHTYDGLLPNSASIKEQFGKYLDLYT